MRSYGELLRTTREAKGLDISTVSRETTIDSAYIQSMENEAEGSFPGESYLTGFLRNYAEYLELNPNEILSLYHNKTLQESPVPVALLAKEHKNRGPIIAVILLIVLAGGGTGGYFLWNYLHPEEEIEEEAGPKIRQFTLGGEPLSERLYRGDQILVPTYDAEGNENGGHVVLTVSSTLTSLGIDTPIGTIRTDLADENEIDTDGDGTSDVIVYVSEISMTDESRGARVKVMLSRMAEGAVFTDDTDVASTDAAESDAAPAAEAIKGRKPVVILEDNRAYSFTIDAVFRGPCEFRHRIDRKAAEERYYSNGDTVTMTAFNGIRLWMSNANAVKLSIVADAHGYDIEIGKAGQVLVEDIKWIKVNGNYRLVALELD